MAAVYSTSALWHVGRELGKPRISSSIYSRLKDFGICKPFRGSQAGIHKQRGIKVFIGNRSANVPVHGVGKAASNLINLQSNHVSYFDDVFKPIPSLVPSLVQNSFLEYEQNPDISLSKPTHVNHSNLTSITLQESKENSTKIKNARFCYMNARSVCNKAEEIASYITENQIDILAIAETWLKSGEGDKIVRGDLTPHGYKLLSVPRPRGRGGGVAIVHADSLSIKKQQTSAYQSFEYTEVLMDTGNDCIRFSVIYRPPPHGKSGHPTETFFTEFQAYMDSHTTTSGKLIVVGDFNFHYNNESDVESRKFKDLLFSLNLEQHVHGATHDKGNQLDLVITRADEHILKDVEISGPGFADHFPISFHIPWNEKKSTFIQKQFRQIKKIDIDAFCLDIQQSPLVQNRITNLNELVETYNEVLKKTLDKHAPLVSRNTVIRDQSPWFTDAIKSAKTERRKLERKWRASKLTIHQDMYKECHKKVKNLCIQAKSEYYCNKIEEAGEDQKKLYQIANTLMHKKQVKLLPTHASDKDLADKFADFFSEKIDKIRREFPATTCSTMDQANVVASPAKLLDLSPVTENEVEKLICSGNSKSCQLDPIPTTLLKQILPSILPVICNTVNLSFQNRAMPESLKTAVVTPLLKKSTLDQENMKNFRPVSNLPYIGKVIEKIVVQRIEEHLTRNNLSEPLQSAYKPNHSTETALLKVSNDILLALDKRKCVLLVLLDLSAAFDTIDHSIFLQWLEQQCGVGGKLSEWLESYFSGRYQSVGIYGEQSKPKALKIGFPQGSNIGPCGFKIYSKPLVKIAQKHRVSIHLYADDTQLYLGFDPAEAEIAVRAMEECLREIRQWMIDNFLKLNEDKTEVLILASKHDQPLVSNLQIKVGNVSVKPSKWARNIGGYFDDELNLCKHVGEVSRSCYGQLRYISQIRKYLTLDATKKLVHSFISSRLDNLNSLLYNLPQFQLHKLQLIHNNAARVIVQIHRSEHITPVLQTLHWLPVEKRVIYKILSIAHKALHNKGPAYLNSLVHMYTPKRPLRSGNLYLLDCTVKVHKKYGSRAFAVCAPNLWNCLPVSIRKCGLDNDDVKHFQSLIKTHLFKCAFNL
jgi:exonuclease III